jgi:hypothetical protein
MLVTCFALLVWWINTQKFERTEDAYVTGHIYAMSFRVSGTISELHLSRFFDRKIDLWFSLHGYPLIRTAHTGFSHFNCLSKLVITASEAGAVNTGVRHRAISKSRLAIAFRSSVLGVRCALFAMMSWRSISTTRSATLHSPRYSVRGQP